MTRSEYHIRALEAWTSGKISEEAYDASMMMADIFCDEEEGDERFPSTYCEIEYADLDTPEALAGARFDDMNYQRYFER